MRIKKVKYRECQEFCEEKEAEHHCTNVHKAPQFSIEKEIRTETQIKVFKSLNVTLGDYVANFQILPDSEVFQVSSNDAGLDLYLKELRINKEKSESTCLFCNSKECYMFPIFFETKAKALEFHSAVIAYQLYHKYCSEFFQMKEKKRIQNGMNIKLLLSLGLYFAKEDFCIDPEELSIVEYEEFELKIMKETIELITKRRWNIKSKLSSFGIRMPIQSENIITFALRLRYKIVDSTSLSYLPMIINEEIIREHVKEFDIKGCSVSDKFLNIMLTQSNQFNSKNNQISIEMSNKNVYQSLMKLNLSNNQLTDVCFISLSILASVSPLLSNIILDNNYIKLLSISAFKKESKENIRMSRLSANLRQSFTNSTPSSPSPSNISTSSTVPQEPLFIQFLCSLTNKYLNFVSMENNQIENPEILIEYIIYGKNVPIKYLSIKDNKLSEIDKICMIKELMNEIKSEEEEYITLIDFGHVSIINEEIYQYSLLLKEKQLEIQSLENYELTNEEQRVINQVSSFSSFEINHSFNDLYKSNSSFQLSIKLNKEWEFCDQSGIFEVNSFYRRRKTTSRKSQLMAILAIKNQGEGDALLEKNFFEPEPVRADTLKSTVGKLKDAYLDGNYAAVGLYTELLVNYNAELYAKKISPIYTEPKAQMETEKEKIICFLNEIVNFEPSNGSPHANLNNLHISTISSLFLHRVEPKASTEIILYKDTEDEEIIYSPSNCNNVFSYIIYLRMKVEEKIEEMIKNKVNPYQEIINNVIKQKNIYEEYYGKYYQWVCNDDYHILLEQIFNGTINWNCKKDEARKGESSVSQNSINEIIKINYLKACRLNGFLYSYDYRKISKEEMELCLLEPKIMPTGFLTKYLLSTSPYTTLLPELHCDLLIYNPLIPSPVSQDLPNILEHISEYNPFNNFHPIFSSTLSLDSLSTYEGIKIAEYNPEFISTLEKFTQLVIAFIKFLNYSPSQILPETLQYLNYLINIVLSENNNYNKECLATEFYLQFITYDVALADQTKPQVKTEILAAVLEFSTYYMPVAESVQNYLIAHILRAQMAQVDNQLTPIVGRMIRFNESRFGRREDQLHSDIVTYLFSTLDYKVKNGFDLLSFPVQIHFAQQQGFPSSPHLLYVHIFTSLEEIIRKIDEEVKIISENRSNLKYLEFSKNWALFVCNKVDNKCTILLPASTEKYNIYTLLRLNLITLNGSSYLMVKSIIFPLYQPINNEDKKEISTLFNTVYQAFRENGTLLSLISSSDVHVSEIIIECIICHIFINHSETILKILEDTPFNKKELLELCDSYILNLEQYCPKGTSVTLSNQDKLFIESELNKNIQDMIVELRNNLSENTKEQLFEHTNDVVKKFENKCELIINEVILKDQSSNQEIVITNKGIIHIERYIYGNGTLWRNVFDIKLIYEGNKKEGYDEQIEKILIYYYENKNENVETITIQSSASKDSAIFINALLVIIKNVFINIVNTPLGHLYQFISSCDKYEPVEKETKGYVQNQRPFMWNEIVKTIKYTPLPPFSTLESKPSFKEIPIDSHEESVDDKLAGYLIEAEKMEQSLRDSLRSSMRGSVNINNTPILPFEIEPEEKKHEPIMKRNSQPSPKNISEQKVKTIEAETANEIGMESILGEVKKNERESMDMELEEKRKTMKEVEDVVITNVRKSGRRELPKRRSSKERNN